MNAAGDPSEPADDDVRGAEPLRGIDLARRALEEARAHAKANGRSVGQGRASPSLRPRRRRRRGWSGPGPDERDPQRLGIAAGELVRRRGWGGQVGEGTVFGSWDRVVGPDIASHAQPTSLREGVLHVSAESTAWATQLRLMQSQILASIAQAVGPRVVRQLRITGPTAPSWRKGERHVKGRGPRDTYG